MPVNNVNQECKFVFIVERTGYRVSASLRGVSVPPSCYSAVSVSLALQRLQWDPPCDTVTHGQITQKTGLISTEANRLSSSFTTKTFKNFRLSPYLQCICTRKRCLLLATFQIMWKFLKDGQTRSWNVCFSSWAPFLVYSLEMFLSILRHEDACLWAVSYWDHSYLPVFCTNMPWL